jgi:threonine/homoserine/homoserine lactone efflux protein
MIFLMAFGISALGSLPPGVINLWVTKIALQNGQKKAITFALVSAFLEIPHIIISLVFYSYLFDNKYFISVLNVLTICFLLVLALGLFFSKSQQSNHLPHTFSIGKIISINLLNPMAIPFWLVMINYLNLSLAENTVLTHFLWIMAATLGCFSTLLVYVFLGVALKNYLQKINKILAVIYGLMAFIKLYQNLYS